MFKAYKAKQNELKEFADELEDLMDRVATTESIFLSLEGRVNENLCVPLEMMLKTLTKTQVYIDKLSVFLLANSGKPLRAIMMCATTMMLNAIPKDMVPYQDTIVQFTEQLGAIPESKFGKFAQDLHFYVSAAAATAGAQNLQGQDKVLPAKTSKPKKAVGTSSVEMGYTVIGTADGDALSPTSVVAVPLLTRQSTVVAAEFQDIDLTTLTQEQIQNKMINLVTTTLEEDVSDVKVILLQGTSYSLTWMFAVWLNNQPHLMYMKFVGRCIDTIQLARAPSTDFLLRIQYDGVDKVFGIQSCAATFARAIAQTRKEQNLSIWTYYYSGKYYKKVTHKVLFAATQSLSFVGLCLVAPCFSGITISKLMVEGKPYCVQMRKSTCVIVNGVVMFDSGNRTDGVGTKFV